MAFPCDAVVKNPPIIAEDTRDMGSIPGLGRPLEITTHSMGNPINIRAWQATIHGVTKI